MQIKPINYSIIMIFFKFILVIIFFIYNIETMIIKVFMDSIDT